MQAGGRVSQGRTGRRQEQGEIPLRRGAKPPDTTPFGAQGIAVVRLGEGGFACKSKQVV